MEKPICETHGADCPDQFEAYGQIAEDRRSYVLTVESPKSDLDPKRLVEIVAFWLDTVAKKYGLAAVVTLGNVPPAPGPKGVAH